MKKIWGGQCRSGESKNKGDDQRFTAYYGAIAVGCTQFLRDAIWIYCESSLD